MRISLIGMFVTPSNPAMVLYFKQNKGKGNRSRKIFFLGLALVVVLVAVAKFYMPVTALFYVLFGELPGVALWTVATTTALKVLASGLLLLLISWLLFKSLRRIFLL